MSKPRSSLNIIGATAVLLTIFSLGSLQWDAQKARDLREKQRAGVKLSPEEEEDLRGYNKWRRQQREEFLRRNPPRDSTGLVPLMDLKGNYRQEEGGLYPGGLNQPPPSHLLAGLRLAAEVLPRDGAGQPDPRGRVVLLSVGMSNTTQEFQAFQRLAEKTPDLHPALLLVDGAQGGQAADATADRQSPYWQEVEQHLQAAGVTPLQVQVAWIKQATRSPSRDFPVEVEALKEYLTGTVQNLRKRFPNLKLAYLSSRIYAGYAVTPLSPEPHAYESAFAVKWLIRDQIDGRPEVNFDPERGPVRAPWLAWGPYLWADGITPRSDGLGYTREDLADDGTHPSPRGQEKVAQLLMDFFRTDPTTRGWFLKHPTLEERP